MTKLTQDQIRHVAKLARLSLSETEVGTFAGQLSSVFEYMDILNEVDIQGVEPTSQVTGLFNVTREDRTESWGDSSSLLQCSPFPIQNDQIRVKPIL